MFACRFYELTFVNAYLMLFNQLRKQLLAVVKAVDLTVNFFSEIKINETLLQNNVKDCLIVI